MGTLNSVRTPHMSRAHFELIAEVLREAHGQSDGMAQTLIAALADDFADALYRTNPRFDRGRFVRRSTECRSQGRS